jgi:hypothetical protein
VKQNAAGGDIRGFSKMLAGIACTDSDGEFEGKPD